MQKTIAWIAVAAACMGGCTEYLGPPASPDYWKAKEQPPVEDDTEEEAEATEEQQRAPEATPLEPGTVIIVQQEAEPAPRPRARSISLGYMGEGVLAGGITRDTVIPPKGPYDPYAPTNWQGYVNAPKWRSAGPQFRPSEQQMTGFPRPRFNSLGMSRMPESGWNCGR